MSLPAGLEPEPSIGPRRLADAFVWAPTPPRPDAEHVPEIVPIDIFLPVDDEGSRDERLTAAAKLSAVVVVAGLGTGLALWAFGSTAVRLVTGLLS